MMKMGEPERYPIAYTWMLSLNFFRSISVTKMIFEEKLFTWESIQAAQPRNVDI